METVIVIFPHQLFEVNPLLDQQTPVYLVEEFLFFKQYPFHKQKIAFHRASMKAYERFLSLKKETVHYIESHDDRSDIRKLIAQLAKDGVKTIQVIDPTDNWLLKRIKNSSLKHEIALQISNSPLFINTQNDLSDFFKPSKKKFFQTQFYIAQRKKLNLLIENKDQPVGGKWSFDAENRKKYPKKKLPPAVSFPDQNEDYLEAKTYVEKYFADNLGTLTQTPFYPHDFQSAKKWFSDFLKERFVEFGTYEDAIVKEEVILNHSVLTPMLNVGLVTPQSIIQMTLAHAATHQVPINSVEGFVRQITGWREFIRGIYEVKGTQERTTNFWGFKRKIPVSFYNGTTGIPPVDLTIKKLLKTGYCHHIERLMVLGNFMLLCEFDPDEVYRWFMELFIDAYDWVMVPNIYGMSQFSDGGLMSTKPYISGSNYLMKMSNYTKGDWQVTWDALFWRFMHVHRAFFLKNPRLGMLVKNFDKMEATKQEEHLRRAEEYLKSLDLN